MAMPQVAQDRRYTVEEVLAFPDDGNRYELAHGELLVSPAPRSRHQAVLGELYFRLAEYLKPQRHVARVLFSPADISWARDVLVQPDLFVFPSGEWSESWTTIRTLLLAVEVLSPSTARHDRVTKRKLYQEYGVATYWIVDPDARVVEVWHPSDERPEIVTEELRWRVAEQEPELVLPIAELCALP